MQEAQDYQANRQYAELRETAITKILTAANNGFNTAIVNLNSDDQEISTACRRLQVEFEAEGYDVNLTWANEETVILFAMSFTW